MVMVVSDQAFGVVGCPPINVLWHVHSSGICIPSLNCILAIPPDSSDWVTENKLFKTPLPEDQSHINVLVLESLSDWSHRGTYMHTK
jgi:hypothetical protein